jgi:hypothetical protein
MTWWMLRRSWKPMCERPGIVEEKRWFEIHWANGHFTRITAKNRDVAEGWALGASDSPVASVKEVANGGGYPLQAVGATVR